MNRKFPVTEKNKTIEVEGDFEEVREFVVLKTKIQSNKSKDLIGFIKGLKNDQHPI